MCGCLNMCFHYLEREIFLENKVNSWKKKLDSCRGRLNCCVCFFLHNIIDTTTLCSGVSMLVVFNCTFCFQNKRNKRHKTQIRRVKVNLRGQYHLTGKIG